MFELAEELEYSAGIGDNKAVEEMLDICWKNTAIYLKTFYPDVFNAPWGRKHSEFFEVIDDNSIRFVVICTHRGFGKTTIVRHGVMGKPFVYGSIKHMLSAIVQPSETDAKNSLKTVRNQLENNQRIIDVFGDIRSKNWSNEQIQSKSGNIIVARGKEQSVRGLNINDRRPDFVVLDDVEKTDKIMSDIERKKTLSWAYTDVKLCFDELKADGEEGRLIAIGNMMHQDGMIANFQADSDFTSITIPLCDDNFKTYWTYYKTDEQIVKMVNNHRKLNTMNEFYREMMCKPSGSETQKFKSEMFRYYNSSTVPIGEQIGEKYIPKTEAEIKQDFNIVNMVTVDPAGTVTRTSDPTAMCLSGFERTTERIYIRKIINKVYGTGVIDLDTGREKMDIDSIVTDAFDLAEKNLAVVIGVETVGLKEFILYPFRLEKARRGSNIKIVELNARGGKNTPAGKERIGALIDMYQKGYIIHNEQACNVLESQLISYPFGKFDDVADVVAYIIMVLDMGLIFFDPPDYGYEGAENVESEYDDLYESYEHDELETVKDWRTV